MEISKKSDLHNANDLKSGTVVVPESLIFKNRKDAIDIGDPRSLAQKVESGELSDAQRELISNRFISLIGDALDESLSK
jgi:hypothetical protein